MKAKVQVVIETEHGQFIVHDVATITKATPSPGTLMIEELKSLPTTLIAGIEY